MTLYNSIKDKAKERARPYKVNAHFFRTSLKNILRTDPITFIYTLVNIWNIYISISVSISICISISVYVYLYLLLYPHKYTHNCLSLHKAISIYLCIFLSIYTHMRLSAYTSISIYVYLFLYSEHIHHLSHTHTKNNNLASLFSVLPPPLPLPTHIPSRIPKEPSRYLGTD